MAYGIRTERLCMKDIDEYYGDSAGGEHTAEGTFSGCNGESSCVIIPVDGDMAVVSLLIVVVGFLVFV